MPMARQAFLAVRPQQGEIVNNFVMQLQSMVENCDYGTAADNQVRDQTLMFINDKSLKSRHYREDDLTLVRL